MQWSPGSIAVTGADGQLGREICRQLGPAAVPLPRSRLDITSADAVRDAVARLRPRAIINCAAWTAVDRAETEPEACALVNATAVGWLAAACRVADAVFVHISTDYVFGADRLRRRPYREDDATGPLNVYGQSKCAGEDAARAHDDHLIIRTCGLYAAGSFGPQRGRNFFDTMMVLAEGGDTVRVVSDQHCTPSYVPHVAAGILGLLARGRRGTFHVVNDGATTWHEAAETLFRIAGKAMQVQPISSADYPTAAVRPGYAVLDTGAFVQATGAALPHWTKGLEAYVRANADRGSATPAT